jgi:hypothetical protein
LRTERLSPCEVLSATTGRDVGSGLIDLDPSPTFRGGRRLRDLEEVVVRERLDVHDEPGTMVAAKERRYMSVVG